MRGFSRDEEGSPRRAYALRQRAKALRTLGLSAEAARAEAEARSIYGEAGSHDVLHLELHVGRQAVAQGDLRSAEHYLGTTCDLAVQVLAPAQLSKALASLAGLYGQANRRTEAMDHCVAALVAWPWDHALRDFRSMVGLFEELAASTGRPDVGHLLNGSTRPMRLAALMPHHGEERVLRIGVELGMVGPR